MSNHNLLLSEKAHIDTIPRLEIEANDVKASHGATISHLDAEQMFYLQARGINKTDAEAQLVEGFYEDFFGRVKNDTIQNLLRHASQV